MTQTCNTPSFRSAKAVADAVNDVWRRFDADAFPTVTVGLAPETDTASAGQFPLAYAVPIENRTERLARGTLRHITTVALCFIAESAPEDAPALVQAIEQTATELLAAHSLPDECTVHGTDFAEIADDDLLRNAGILYTQINFEIVTDTPLPLC